MFEKTQKEALMKEALKLAEQAQEIGEIPIGAVVVNPDGEIIGRGFNLRETKQDALLHAEMIAINQACEKIESWRLEDCSLFVTLEPCPMCAGAIINSRIKDVYFGAADPKAGSCGTVIDLFNVPKFNHHPHSFPGLYADRSSQLLKDFFQAIRQKKTQNN